MPLYFHEIINQILAPHGAYFLIIFLSHWSLIDCFSTYFSVSDVLLAQLMGVHSLAAAGLTRQQCLSQLRGSLGNEDSEK